MPRRYVLLSLLLLLAACSTSKRAVQPAEPAPEAGLLAEPLGLDPAVLTGTLPNGLTYFVRRNAEPRARAELRLVVDAGSVLEDDDQRGLAHFLEHMAFNGTERYAKQELVDYLEGIGMRFGPDLNAYTSFDETVYMLQVPTDSAGLLATGFEILSEWAARITLDPDAIEKERGVVLEEWRAGRGAQARVNDRHLPVLLGGSRYAERLPIGTPEVIRDAPPEAFRRFYEAWYRPELMAVVAVGDFDPDEVERAIRETFGDLEDPAEAEERPAYPVPPHDSTRVSVATDPELTATSVTVYFKEPPSARQDVAAFRDRLKQRLANRMLNARLYERTRLADPPYIGAFTGKAGLVRAADTYVMQAVVEDGGAVRGLDALLTEAARVRRHGFTETELERTKADLLRELEVAFNERETTRSADFAGALVRHYLEGEPAPGIAREYALAQELLPTITVAELDALAGRVTGEGDRVVLVSAPQKEGVAAPTEAQLRAVFRSVEEKAVEPYDDAVSAEPLVAAPPVPAAVASVSTYEDGSGITEYVLENGARVVLKPTDFKADEVLFAAFSPGGSSLVPDSLFRAAQQAAAAVGVGGLGVFSATELDKKLAGEAVRVQPYVDEREEGFVGSAAPSDLETLFQLVHLHFTAPRADAEAFEAYKQRYAGLLANRSAQPEAAFSDTLQVTLAQRHPRRRPLTIDDVHALRLDAALGVYRDRFADASDFTFVLVGAFEPGEVEPLVRRYLATLPAVGREEEPRDLGVRPPGGVVEKTVRRGIEPRARVQLVFPGALDVRIDTLAVTDTLILNGQIVPVADSIYAARVASARAERYLLGALSDALRIRLREELREDRGGVYGVGVSARVDRMLGRYTVSIGFGADPERVDELVGAVIEEVERFQDEGSTEDVLQKVKEADRRAQQLALRENESWLGAISSAYQHGEAPAGYLDQTDLIESLSYGALRGAAQRYLGLGRYVKVVLLPEE